MSVRRGGSLENAILKASRYYRAEGHKIVLLKQEPRQAAHGQQSGYAAGGAPCDFLGSHIDVSGKRGVCVAIEAKTTKGKSLALSRLRDDQIKLMGLLHNAGADVSMVVYFSDLDECYSVPWVEVVTFIATAYRASWPLCWFRVYGTLLPSEEDASGWRVRFLDGAPHKQREEAKGELERDQAKPRSSYEPDEDEAPQIQAPRESEAERRLRIQAIAQEGMRRQQKKPAWGRR